MKKYCILGLVFLFVFCLSGVLGLNIDVNDNVLLYPNQEFYLIMMVENAAQDSYVNIAGYSKELNVSWNKSVFLVRGSGVRVGFVIDPIEREGEYEIVWTAKGNLDEVVNAKTKILVSGVKGSIGEVIGYYGFELDKLEGSGNSDYLKDARKNFNVAKSLSDRGMDFEAKKYLDFSRESLKMAIEKENPSGDFNLVGEFSRIGFWFLVLIILLVGFLVLRRIFLRFGDFKGRRVFKKRGRKKVVLPSYILEIRQMRRRIERIEDLEKKRELLIDLDNCEEKFRLGLSVLGRAYLKKIERVVDRVLG